MSVVRTNFSQAITCPEGRIEVSPRTDLAAEEVPWALGGSYPPSAADPPADVAADPERLRLWRDRREASERDAREQRAKLRVYVASGCGTTVFYLCRLLYNRRTGDRTECVQGRATPRDAGQPAQQQR
jgi:hypothetical protein